MPQIQNGTVNVTNGSATVTGNGTTWLSDGIAPGAVFIRATLVNGNRVDDVVPYFVASVTSDEELQLSAPYQGVTGTDQPYGITIDLTGTGLPLLGPRSIGSVPIFNQAVSVLDARLAGVEQTENELGTAAFEDVTETPYDNTTGRVLTVGDFGFTTTQNGNELFDNDFNTFIPHAVNVTTTTTWLNGPLGDATHTGTLYQSAPRSLNSVMVQRWVPQQGAGAAHVFYERTIRQGIGPEDWTDWVRIVTTNDLSESATPSTIPIRGAESTANEGTFEVAPATEDNHPVTLSQLESIEAADIAYDNAESSLTATDIQAAIDELKANAAWLGTAIGETKHLIVDDSALLPDPNSQIYRYLMLTAGQDGAGGYNEGLLINEDIDANYVDGNGHSGLRVTAEINMPSSPLHGKVIDLINSSGAFIRPGETSGVFEHDQMQRITGRARWRRNGRFERISQEGAVFLQEVPANHHDDAGGAGERNVWVNVDSSLSPNARTSATTAGQTQPTNTTGVFLLRAA